jgi:major membrane immunogen (membrane-anchored lipoprotein)
MKGEINMKQRRKIFAAVSSLAVVSTVLLAGCSSPAKEETALENLTVKENENASEETGTLMLSVNPEIRIDYDKDGKVITLAGQNGDGKKVVNGYADYSKL